MEQSRTTYSRHMKFHTGQTSSHIANEEERLLLRSMLSAMEACLPPSQSLQVKRLMHDLRHMKADNTEVRASTKQTASTERAPGMERNC